MASGSDCLWPFQCSLAVRTGRSQSVVMHTYTWIKGLALRFTGGSEHSCPHGFKGVSVLQGSRRRWKRIEFHGWEGLSFHRGHRVRTAPAPPPPFTAPSYAWRPRGATSGARSTHDDSRVIVPAHRILLRRRISGCWRDATVRLEAPYSTAVDPTRPPVRRVGRQARRAQVCCAAERRPCPLALRHAGGPPPFRGQRRRPFPCPAAPPPQ